MANKKTKRKVNKGGAPRGNKNAVGNEGGKPTTYGPHCVEIAKKYIQRCMLSMQKGVSYHELPMIAGLAIDLQCDKETVTAWSKLHVEFGRLVKWIRLEQEKALANGGVSGMYNSGMARFILSAHHGYAETVKHQMGELQKDDLEDLSNEELERIANGG